LGHKELNHTKTRSWDEEFCSRTRSQNNNKNRATPSCDLFFSKLARLMIDMAVKRLYSIMVFGVVGLSGMGYFLLFVLVCSGAGHL